MFGYAYGTTVYSPNLILEIPFVIDLFMVPGS